MPVSIIDTIVIPSEKRQTSRRAKLPLMTALFVLTSLAEYDLDEAFHNLARNPKLGHSREELAGKLVHSYLIVYRWQTKPTQIVRVLHAARDVQALFDLTS